MTNNLLGVLCRFRKEHVAITCDIEGMFHQVKVTREDRDLLRFLWFRDSDPTKEPLEFRMTVHLFGATSSPGCANFALKTTANQFEERHGKDAADFIRNDFYVDDGLRSVSTKEEAIELVVKTQKLCSEGGFRLQKFVSNDKDVIRSIPVADRGKDLQQIDLLYDDLPVERALGVLWCVESDTFTFRVTLSDSPPTRRCILSIISFIFDPMGLVGPFVLRGKSILQELCKYGADWDDEISEVLRSKWERWYCDVQRLSSLSIPRCYKSQHFGELKTAELHHFSDASLSGIGQCSYLRLQDNKGSICTSLVMGKSRVTPSKVVTVPRLELTAAVNSVRVSKFLTREMKIDRLRQVFWTNSKVVLGYISNEARRFHIFVANRVQEIRTSTSPSDWKHVPTAQNPADLASRGLSATELIESHMWWRGPEFLSTTGTLPPTEFGRVPDNDPELRKTVVHSTKVTEEPPLSLSERLPRFSSWDGARRAVALCVRYKNRLKSASTKIVGTGHKNPITVQELNEAEKIILRSLQSTHFQQELKALYALQKDESDVANTTRRGRSRWKMAGSLCRLDPYIDEDGLIRVGGRIRRANLPREEVHPIVLPRRSHLTRLIISRFHNKTGHSGGGMTLNALRSNGYWIIAGRAEVTSHVWKCVTCRKLRAKPQGQKMSDLPADRLEPAPPFTYCAVDCFGPFFIKEGRKECKRFGMLYTCLASRAVHLEVAHTMNTDSFLNSYRRFVCRRGPVRQLRSDRGTNFIGARGEQEAALAELDQE